MPSSVRRAKPEIPTRGLRGRGAAYTHTHAGTPDGFGQTTQPFLLLFRFLGTLSSLRHEADVEAATPDRETDTKCDARALRPARYRHRGRGGRDSAVAGKATAPTGGKGRKSGAQAAVSINDHRLAVRTSRRPHRPNEKPSPPSVPSHLQRNGQDALHAEGCRRD